MFKPCTVECRKLLLHQVLVLGLSSIKLLLDLIEQGGTGVSRREVFATGNIACADIVADAELQLHRALDVFSRC